ncbi:MBL fold metallo-hydrolase [Nocardia sp. NPDC051570]|uniref:MBL fold metallo-hydrolase n=1 Tax=Nocardia sp. NPDC051570 TaxID=3364324 RepID=UPI00379B1D8D
MTAPLGWMRSIGDEIYAYLQPDGGWCLNNVGIVVGSDLTVMIDTAATERRTRALLAEVQALAPDLPRVVVNTHFHGDHTLGNAFLDSGTRVFAHVGMRALMAETGLAITELWPEVEWGAVRVRLPDVEVSDFAVLHTGSHRIELRHIGVSHTDHDLVAWLPEQSVLFAGDQVMSGCTPFLLFGSVVGGLEVLEVLRDLRPRVVVPGHGTVTGARVIDDNITYLEWILALAELAILHGRSPLRVVGEAGPGPFPDWIDAERHVANVHRAMADLRGVPGGTPLDLAGVMADMATACPHRRVRSRA